MDIAALSIASAQAKNLSDVGIAMMAKTLDMVEEQSAEMIKMMELSVNPSVGANFDVRV